MHLLQYRSTHNIQFSVSPPPLLYPNTSPRLLYVSLTYEPDPCKKAWERNVRPFFSGPLESRAVYIVQPNPGMFTYAPSSSSSSSFKRRGYGAFEPHRECTWQQTRKKKDCSSLLTATALRRRGIVDLKKVALLSGAKVMCNAYEVQRRTCWKRKEKPFLTKLNAWGNLLSLKGVPVFGGGGGEGGVHFR